jgi:diadenosine tetraphosphatase ApaH/serine/threonine PP2A family protein phosphatase
MIYGGFSGQQVSGISSSREIGMAMLGAIRAARGDADRADVPDYGLLNDLVWSDPSDTALDWEDNERGVSFCYGKSVINAFLATHVSKE